MGRGEGLRRGKPSFVVTQSPDQVRVAEVSAAPRSLIHRWRACLSPWGSMYRMIKRTLQSQAM